MLLKLKAALASVILMLGVGSIPSVEAAKRLTVPDPDWTGGVVTCRTIHTCWKTNWITRSRP